MPGSARPSGSARSSASSSSTRGVLASQRRRRGALTSARRTSWSATSTVGSRRSCPSTTPPPRSASRTILEVMLRDDRRAWQLQPRRPLGAHRDARGQARDRRHLRDPQGVGGDVRSRRLRPAPAGLGRRFPGSTGVTEVELKYRVTDPATGGAPGRRRPTRRADGHGRTRPRGPDRGSLRRHRRWTPRSEPASRSACASAARTPSCRSSGWPTATDRTVHSAGRAGGPPTESPRHRLAGLGRRRSSSSTPVTRRSSSAYHPPAPSQARCSARRDPCRAEPRRGRRRRPGAVAASFVELEAEVPRATRRPGAPGRRPRFRSRDWSSSHERASSSRRWPR